MTARSLSVLVLLATVAVTVASSSIPETTEPGAVADRSSFATAATPASPKPLRGTKLSRATGLRILVANAPPLLLDADSGRVERITGLNLRGHAVVSVHPVGAHTIIWLQRNSLATRHPRAEIYVVRRGATRANRLATAWEVASSADGRGVWLKAFDVAGRCMLRETGLDGSDRQPARQVPCSARLVATSTGALLIDGSSVIDPRSRATLFDTNRLWATVGDFAVTAEGRLGPLAVIDMRTGERWPLPYPSRVAGQGGLDEAAVHPRGELVALSFSDPAYEFTGTQVTDIWLLDTRTRALRQLPDMPAAVSLKFTSMSWTSDGRLVTVAETGQRTLLAIWRPGWTRMKVRSLGRVARNGGSDTFVVWPATRSR